MQPNPLLSRGELYLSIYNYICAVQWGIILVSIIIGIYYKVRLLLFSMIEGLCEVCSHWFSLLSVFGAAAAAVVVE